MEIILDTASLNIPQGQQVTNQPAIMSAPTIQEIPSEQIESEISAELPAPTIQEIPSEQVESEINAVISAPTILSNILLPSTTGSYTDPYDPDSIRFINNKEVYTCTGMCGMLQEKLSPYQTKLLLNPINIDGTLVTNVEQALSTLNSARRQVNVDWDATTGITAICNKPVLASVATVGTYASLLNKPDFSNVAYTGSYNDLRDVPELSPAATEGQVNADWNATEGVAEVLNKPSLSCVACSGNYNDLTNKPDLGSIQIQSDWEEDNTSCKSYIRNKPTLSRVACSGQYADLMGAPVITPQVNADWNAISGVAQILNKPALAPVALSGDYNDLRNIPPDTSKTYSFSFNNDTHKLTVTEHNIFNDNVIFDTVIDTVYSFSYTDNEIIILDNYGVQHTINLGNDFYTKAEVDALIEGITDLIPEQASPTNQLADKAFVNSTIQTATANFRGNWATWFDVPTQTADYPEDYAGSKTPTINDYLVVQDASDYTEQTLEGTWRFKYTGTWNTDGKNGWIPEYQVNETPLTAAQLAALNSGITCEAVAKITDVYNCTISLCNSTGTALLGSFTLNQNQNSAICLNVGTLTGICLNNNTATVTNGCAKLDITPSLSYCSTNRQLVTQLGNKCSSAITLPAGINCTGTLVASDIANFITDISVKVYCGATCKCTLCKASSLCLGSNAFNSTAFTTCKGTVTKVTLGTSACSPDTSGNITLPAYPPDLSSCPGLSCTGTLVASDIANFITDIGVKVYCGTICKCTLCKASSLCLGSNAFNSTAFTTCKGTVTKVTLGSSACSPDTSGNITLPAYPPDLSSCPGLNCTGTLVASDIANFITDIGVKVYCGTTCKCTLCKASSLCLGSNAFNSTAFTTCKGTVTKVTLGSSACSPDTSGNITLPAYPPDLSSCPGLSCTGTLVASDLNGYATESWVTGKNYCIHDCLVKLVKLTSSATSADRNILIMGNGFVDGCICPVYFSDTCKLTFNPINGQLKSSIFGYNKGGVTSRNINGYNSKNYTGGTRCTAMDICTFFKCFAACHSLAPAEDLTVKYTWGDACNNIICWGTSSSINLSGASVQVCSNSYTVNLFNDSCSGWYNLTLKISCISGIEWNFRACKGSNTAVAATIICNRASVNYALRTDSAANATCFGGCTYAQACTNIRSGLLTDISIDVYCGTSCKCTVNNNGSICLGSNAFNSTAFCNHDCLVKLADVSSNADRAILQTGAGFTAGCICPVYKSSGVPFQYNACCGCLKIGNFSCACCHQLLIRPSCGLVHSGPKGTQNNLGAVYLENNCLDNCSIGVGIGSGNVNRGFFDYCKASETATSPTFRWLQYWDAENEIHALPIWGELGANNKVVYSCSAPAPSNIRRYVLVCFDKVYCGNPNSSSACFEIDIYTSKYYVWIDAANSAACMRTYWVNNGVNPNASIYGSFCTALPNTTMNGNCFWITYSNYRAPVIKSARKITILCNTTTAPSGITFSAPTNRNNYTDVYCGATCVCTLQGPASLCLSANAFNTNAQISTTTYPGACCTGDVQASSLCTVATSGKYCDLIGLPTIPAAQVNSDWNATSGVAQILNKPTIPAAANNGKITLCVNSTCVCSFTVNQSANTNITLPDYPPDLSSCPGLDCTGTLIASDIANFITDIGVKVYCGTTCKCTLCKASSLCLGSNAFNSTAFTTCKGTVTKVTLGTTACSPDTSGNITLPAYPPDLSNCAGLNCTGTVTWDSCVDDDGDVPLLLTQSTGTVGPSVCCSLTYNPRTGTLCTDCLFTSNIITGQTLLCACGNPGAASPDLAILLYSSGTPGTNTYYRPSLWYRNCTETLHAYNLCVHYTESCLTDVSDSFNGTFFGNVNSSNWTISAYTYNDYLYVQLKGSMKCHATMYGCFWLCNFSYVRCLISSTSLDISEVSIKSGGCIYTEYTCFGSKCMYCFCFTSVLPECYTCPTRSVVIQIKMPYYKTCVQYS